MKLVKQYLISCGTGSASWAPHQELRVQGTGQAIASLYSGVYIKYECSMNVVPRSTGNTNSGTEN